MSARAKPATPVKNRGQPAEQQQEPAPQQDRKPFEVPEDILQILNANYEVPQFSDDEEPDDNADELTLDIVSKPIIRQPLDELPAPQEDAVLNEATVEDYLKNTLSQLNLVKTLNQFQSEYLELQAVGGSALDRVNELQNHNTSQLLAENLRLKFELDQLKLQNERVVAAACRAKEQFARLRKQRDYHRTRHRQAV